MRPVPRDAITGGYRHAGSRPSICPGGGGNRGSRPDRRHTIRVATESLTSPLRLCGWLPPAPDLLGGVTDLLNGANVGDLLGGFPDLGGIQNIPYNLFADVVNIPYYESLALQEYAYALGPAGATGGVPGWIPPGAPGFGTDALYTSGGTGSWYMESIGNTWGWDDGNWPQLDGLLHFALPFQFTDPSPTSYRPSHRPSSSMGLTSVVNSNALTRWVI